MSNCSAAAIGKATKAPTIPSSTPRWGTATVISAGTFIARPIISRNQQIVLDVDYLVGEAAQLMALGAGTARRGQATAVPRELSSTG
jgi:hypothetical protein